MDSESNQGENPKPMVNRKPANKNPNAVEKFRVEHQAEHERRHKPPRLCQRVESHNNTCPKLQRQIDRRRSDSKPTALLRQCDGGNQTLGWLDPRCKNCARLESQRRTRSNKNSGRGRHASRVTKTKRARRRRPMVDKALSIMIDVTNNGRKTRRDKRADKQDIDPFASPNKDGETSENSDNQIPVVSPDPSVTTYHSFLSMDHEPMD